jgi:hypothetical protein
MYFIQHSFINLQIVAELPLTYHLLIQNSFISGQIRDILVRIRMQIQILGSVLVTNGSGCGSCSFRQ